MEAAETAEVKNNGCIKKDAGSRAGCVGTRCEL